MSRITGGGLNKLRGPWTVTKGAGDCERLKNSVVAGRADGLKKLERVNETGTVLFRAGNRCEAGKNLQNIGG